MTAPDAPAPAPPTACQWGHPLTWVLAPDHEYADGEGLAVCPCATRRHDGRSVRGASTPVLWRWVPNQSRSLRPVFLSQNRLAFALAVRGQRQAEERDRLTTEVGEATLRAKQVAALATRARRSLAWLDRHTDASLAARAATVRRRLALVPPVPSTEAQRGPDGPE